VWQRPASGGGTATGSRTSRRRSGEARERKVALKQGHILASHAAAQHPRAQLAGRDRAGGRRYGRATAVYADPTGNLADGGDYVARHPPGL
jgi:hypothetical protein